MSDAGRRDATSHAKPYLRVAAGLILDADGRLLLGQRPKGKPWEDWWELPGGKIEPGETVEQALARELDEELGIRATRVYPWVTHVHEYPKNIVELAFCQVTAWDGEPRGLENQALLWVDPGAIRLDQADHPVAPNGGSLLPAAAPPLKWLRLPTRYRISAIGGPEGLAGWLSRLEDELRTGPRLVQFREPGWRGDHASLATAFEATRALCRRHAAPCLVNSVHPRDWWTRADGVHLRAADAASLADTDARPPGMLAVSAHDARDIAHARALEADFLVLGHVLDTPSHAGKAPLGWMDFQALAAPAGRPVFALGGQSADTAETARRHGAHGIAAIRGTLGPASPPTGDAPSRGRRPR
ncbi:Nudix family hydrolase [Castellaniella sp. GW247-6E4]|uniref:Nudix family hydrolase n=1 Tax=Castellaniella sp. GW247-6E4 TaxID=3140380 RepID=UPI003314F505